MTIMKPRFNVAKLRRKFYAWHGGQDSPLYAAASSGLVADTLALQNELSRCAASLWADPANFKGPADQRTIKVSVYAEWKYLVEAATFLPEILSAPGVASDGRTYRCLPWAKKDGKFPLDFMRPNIGQSEQIATRLTTPIDRPGLYLTRKGEQVRIVSGDGVLWNGYILRQTSRGRPHKQWSTWCQRGLLGGLGNATMAFDIVAMFNAPEGDQS